jgi:hypothetical protein
MYLIIRYIRSWLITLDRKDYLVIRLLGWENWIRDWKSYSLIIRLGRLIKTSIIITYGLIG